MALHVARPMPFASCGSSTMTTPIRNRASRTAFIVFAFGCISAGAVHAANDVHPIDVDDLLRIPRVADVQLSPDGRSIAYTVATPNMATNESESNLWIADTATGEPRQITYTGKDRAARWSPDGQRLAFLSRREGKSQVYVLTLGAGEARAVTRFTGDVETVKWMPDGRVLIFSAMVDPDCADDECLKATIDRRGKGVRVYEKWPVRLAMSWADGMSSRLSAYPSEYYLATCYSCQCLDDGLALARLHAGFEGLDGVSRKHPDALLT